MVPARVIDLPRARARYGERIDTLVSYLDRVDPLADEAVAAIEAMPPGTGWRAVEEAAAHGIARVTGAPPALRALFAQIEAIPVWCDWRVIDQAGSMLLRAGPLGGIVLGVKSLVHGYASPGGNKPLIMTGRLEQQAARRLNETARFVQAVCRPRGMRPGGDGWQIAVRVRLIHAQVRRMILRSGRWQPDLWGQPANQHDTAGTSLLFSLSVIEGLRALGVQVGRRETEQYIQLWRLVSHVLGVAPEINPGSFTDAENLAELIQATMGEPDEDSRALTRALLDAPRAGMTTEAELRNAARRTRFAEAMCRHLVGDELADKLGVPRTSWRFTVPLVRRLVSGAELVRANVPFGDLPALLVGARYWDRVVEEGLAGGAWDFALPDRLKAA
jgi:hypothetical protein